MITKTLLLTLIVISIGSFYLGMAKTSSCDEKINDKIVTISGKIRTTEIESGEILIDATAEIVFQRVDCSKCLTVAHANKEGEYSIQVGKGKYRVIPLSCTKSFTNKNCLDPNQPEIINADKLTMPNIFDIRLIHHKDEIPRIELIK